MNTSEEQWAVVEAAPNYDVSTLGRVRRPRGRGANPTNPIVRKACVNSENGYLQVVLYKDGFPTCYYVHRLVAIAFLKPDRAEQDEVAHNDGRRTNNVVTNLRWATHKENNDDKALHGTLMHGATHWKNRLTEIEVDFIRASKLTDEELAILFLYSTNGISNIRAGRSWGRYPFPPGCAPQGRLSPACARP